MYVIKSEKYKSLQAVLRWVINIQETYIPLVEKVIYILHLSLISIIDMQQIIGVQETLWFFDLVSMHFYASGWLLVDKRENAKHKIVYRVCLLILQFDY